MEESPQPFLQELQSASSKFYVGIWLLELSFLQPTSPTPLAEVGSQCSHGELIQIKTKTIENLIESIKLNNSRLDNKTSNKIQWTPDCIDSSTG